MIRTYDFGGKWKTHKWVGVDEIVRDARMKEADTLSVISSGNFLDAILRSAGGEFRVVNLVNKPRGSPCEEVIIPTGRILRDAKERQDYIASTIRAGKVIDYTDFTSQALRDKAREILSSVPDFVGVGVGSGKLFLALADVVDESDLPTKLIGFVPKEENGVFTSDNLYEENGLLKYKSFFPRSIADKLSTPYTFFGDRLRASLKSSGGKHRIIELEEKDFEFAHRTALRKGHFSEPSGSAGFVLYDSGFRDACEIEEGNDVLVINTGNGRKRDVNFRRVGYVGMKILPFVAALGLTLGGYQSVRSYDNYRTMRKIAVDLADYASREIGEEIDIENMSNDELFDYASSERVKDKMGGPSWYW